MSDDLLKEIDAIVQNTGKAKTMAFEVTRLIEISVDKEKSSTSAICGEMAIVTEKRFLDGSKEREDYTRLKFTMDHQDELVFDQYNLKQPISPEIMKIIHDQILAIKHVAAEGKSEFKIPRKNVFGSEKGIREKMLVVCESGKNKGVMDAVEEILFTGQADTHVDVGTWQNSMAEKCKHWSFLEIDRLVGKHKTVVVSGNFKEWYELMPLVVICKMYRVDLVIGKTAGQKLSIGNVIDINEALENFMVDENTLSHFYKDPYSSIEYFRKINDTVSSFVIFPSLLNKFFSR